MEVIFIVLIFSIVQSIFGVGLLLFGTPTLLLLGVGYEQVLWILLPSSITISLYQVFEKKILINSKKEVYIYTIPALIIGLIIVIMYNDSVDIKKIVGLFLLVIGIIRLSKEFRVILKRFIENNFKTYYALMGLVHGISNMGGGMLTVLMSSTYDKKEMIQANISHIYLLFGLSQLLVLSFISSYTYYYQMPILIVLSSFSYYLTNKYLSVFINDSKYQLLITFLVLFYGIVALIIVPQQIKTT